MAREFCRVGGGGNTANRIEYADHDLTISEQFRDVGQKRRFVP